MKKERLKNLIIILAFAAAAFAVAPAFAWLQYHERLKGSDLNAARVSAALAVEHWDGGAWHKLNLSDSTLSLEMTAGEWVLSDNVREFYRFTVKNTSSRVISALLSYLRGEAAPTAGGAGESVYVENMLTYCLIKDEAGGFVPDASYIYSREMRPFDFAKDESTNPYYTAGNAGAEFLLPLSGSLQPDGAVVFFMCFGFNMPVVLEALRLYSDILSLTLLSAVDLNAYGEAVSEVQS